MRLIYTDNSKSLTREQIQKGYGIKNPERISGYAGLFFKVDDLLKLIQRYKLEDYGFVTADEYALNMENRYLCGSCTWSVARYGFGEFGGTVLKFVSDKGFMYYADDDLCI